MTKIIHTTNTHLDRKNMGLQQRQEDYLGVFAETIDYALHTNADAILHTGNLFYSESPAERVVERVREELQRLTSYNLEFYLLYGKSDLQTQSLLSEFVANNYINRLTPGWNRINNIAVFAYDATVDKYESGNHSPPDHTVARVAVVFDEVENVTRFSSIREFESEIGWSLDGVFIGGQHEPVHRIENGVRILSPGSPERVITQSDIDSKNLPPCQIHQYDIDPDGVNLTNRATSARTVEGFQLELQPDDTLADVQSEIEKLGLQRKFAIFEIVGERRENSPSKDEIEDLVSSYAAVARGYDLRTGDEIPKENAGETEGHSLTDIPGVGTARAEKLQDEGISTVSELAEVTNDQLEDWEEDWDMDKEMVKSLRLMAKEIRGDDKTIITDIATEYGSDRECLSDVYASIVPMPGTFDDKVSAIRAVCSDGQSVFTLEQLPTHLLYALHMTGFETIQSVASASIDELKSAPHVTSEAEDIRDAARSAIGYSDGDEKYICNKCGKEFKFEPVLRKHSFSCDGITKQNSESNQNEKYVCDQCGKEFKFEPVLRKHSYSCNIGSEYGASVNGSVEEFTESALERLQVADDDTPDSTPVVRVFEHIQETLKSELGNEDWFQRYIWTTNFETPYIGPSTPETSRYIWLGLIDKSYNSLSRASNALQLEFGVNGGSAPGFFGRETTWGIFMGKWADNGVVELVAENLRENSETLADFLSKNSDYVLVTKTKTLENPSSNEIESIIPKIERGFTITRDMGLSDLESTDPCEEVYKTLEQLVPIYNILSGIDHITRVSTPISEKNEDSTNEVDISGGWDVESLAQATEMNESKIEGYIEYMKDAGYRRDEAIKFVHKYLVDMLRGDGLFAVRNVGPYSGKKLVEAGIESIEDLRTVPTHQLKRETNLASNRLENIQEYAEKNDVLSLNSGDEAIAEQLLASEPEIPPQNSPRQVDDSSNGNRIEDKTQSSTDSVDETLQQTKNKLSLNQWLDQHALAPAELSMPNKDEKTTIEGRTIYPNYITEYYETFRHTRKVLQLVFEIGNVDIDPEDKRDPRVQYFIMLDACIGFSNLSVDFMGYGPQHQDRLPFSVDDYYSAYGDGYTITDYQLINVEPFREETHKLLQREANTNPSTKFVRPCVPGTEMPLPELPGSFEELQRALLILDQFPSYPPLQTENGVNKKTIPIADLYSTYFESLNHQYRVDLDPLKIL